MIIGGYRTRELRLGKLVRATDPAASRRRRSLALAGVVVLMMVLVACEKPEPGPVVPSGQASLPKRAQPRLPTIELWLGTEKLQAEVASTSRERETGMMFRTNIAENEAMLFVFPVPGQVSFWMKNVPIPLSCAYLDPDGVILEIHRLEPENAAPVFAQSHQVQFVLETAEGWFQRKNVGVGVMVRTPGGTLRDLLYRRPSAP